MSGGIEDAFKKVVRHFAPHISSVYGIMSGNNAAVS